MDSAVVADEYKKGGQSASSKVINHEWMADMSSSAAGGQQLPSPLSVFVKLIPGR